MRLTTEHLVDPLGIDATAPRFGWRLEGTGTGRAQTAYQILVASRRRLLRSGRADVWDSGRVESTEQTAQVYGGPVLRARTRYYWTVRAWDEAGRPGPYGRIAWFETAMLSPGDWAAEWIGSGLDIPSAVRVLGPAGFEDFALRPGSTLGQTFVTPGPSVAAAVLLSIGPGTADCVMTLRAAGPTGAVIARRALTGLTADGYGNAQGRLDFGEPVGAGTYYLELSEPRGSVHWLGVRHDDPRQDPYPDGTGYADGEPVNVDRWTCTIPPPPPADPLLRREFHLDGAVMSARLYICGLGHGVAWVNGRRVGDAELSPATTDYDRRLLYTTHDVTSLLRRGNNAIGVALGRGFFATRAPDTDGSNLQPWVSEPQVRAQLEVRLAGGRRVTIGSDRTWHYIEGPTTYDGVFNGESHDARRAADLSGWSSPGFDETSWKPVILAREPGGRLEAFAGEPVRATRIVRPVGDKLLPGGVRQLDFGAVMSGRVRLRGRLPRGTIVRIQYGEKLAADGRVSVGVPGGNENPSVEGRLQLDEYTASGAGEETWQPSFTYKSFQYVEVSGASESLELVAVQLNSDVADTMNLQLGDPVLQWIVDTFARTAANGLHGFPDGSPLAKVGWTGMTHWSSQPMLYRFAMQTVFAKWLDDLRLGQAPDGEIPLIAPPAATTGGFLFTPSSTGVYPYLVHRYWLAYGDRTLPARHFESVRKYVDWCVAKLDSGVSDDQFGDWYPPNPPKEYPRGREGGSLVGVAFVIQSLRQGTALAELLGRTRRAAAWRDRTDELVRQFNDRFLDRKAGLYRTEVADAGYRQTSNAVPLAFDLVPTAHVDAVVANLAADIEARGRHLNTGNVGTATLPYALSDHGRSDLALAVLDRQDHPSYGYLRGLGATTFWESWEADARAHNDATLSGPVAWLVERVAGVEVLEPGWARFRVAPTAFGRLPWARVTLDTVRGRVLVGWRRDGDLVVLYVGVPVNAVAEVTLPNGRRHELGSGRHRISTALR
ncbi:alpha-L-rhamnosidase [Actinopolymorpha singaporensis]|uniref:alpha-L-rhamnosidase n=1 Tax=Actinopolymorpha singaporensis TaxID=117157 RepID=A0A1H1PEX8_9ACTN|nr:alpha-L-rhamnosidase [Actinopolymorpha singaporensis]SDS09667.1 alpha-L-rhamnosidase [Actinopolymorpha singaporensis]